jgi:hypothetical protein
MKIVLNRSVAASFCLSKKGAARLSFLKNQASSLISTSHHIARNDPDLVRVVEELGNEAAGPKNELLVIDIPENSAWRISDVAGYEFIIANGKIH